MGSLYMHVDMTVKVSNVVACVTYRTQIHD